MIKDDKLIKSCQNWDEFFSVACSLPNTVDQGRVFERLTLHYLKAHPEYRSLLDDVWPLRDVPSDVRRKLRLGKLDEGIDLVARTRTGDYWAIQCKFRSDTRHRLTRRELSTFTSLTFHTCKGFSLAVIAHTCQKPVKKHDLLPDTVEIGLDRWLELGDVEWQQVKKLSAGRNFKIAPRSPRPHQKEAIAAATRHFVRQRSARGRLTMPCGTGKSLTAFWIAQALKARTILVAVPSLALIRQSLTDWTREYLARGQFPDWLVVCSDESTGKLERDEFVASTYDLGIPTTTDADEIAAFLKGKSNKPRIIFTTYQSGAKLSAGAKQADSTFDLGILDEAHKTVGAKTKAFAALLFDKNVPIRRRLFMTATERVLSGRNDDVLSMNDAATYGERFYSLSFKRAIEESLISDYRILTVTVSDKRIRQLVEDRRLIDLSDGALDSIDASTVAAGVALKRAIDAHGVRHAVSFHRSIRRAVDFKRQQDALNTVESLGAPVVNLHISSKKSAGERADLLRDFTKSQLALITNARCLTEGVDVPAIDCVVFADPKQSTVDIVQAAGRALRRFEGKDYGFILLPLVVPAGMSFDDFAETTEFRQVAKVITALSVQDERIAEEFRAIDRAKRPSGDLVTIEGDVAVGLAIRPNEFADKIFARVWERVGRANWRSFEDARRFVHTLGLADHRSWINWAKTKDRAPDIPAAPQNVYAESGWAGWGDWLGTGRLGTVGREFRRFEDARRFAHTLGLTSNVEWIAYARSDRRPRDIPQSPNVIYDGAGWKSWGDWLGTGRVAFRKRKFWSFDRARRFVRSLGLKGLVEWSRYAGSGERPEYIPSNPHTHYRGRGWKNWGDFLGSGRFGNRSRTFRSFESARAFVRKQQLKDTREWREFRKTSRRPADIPACPEKTYRGKGWAGYEDWLGLDR